MGRKQITLIVALTLLTIHALAFTAEGNWTLQSSPTVKLGQTPVVLEITDFVYRNQTILQKLIFRSCQEMLLQAQLSENQLFINFNSYYTQHITGKSCSPADETTLTNVYNKLSTVFYFEIAIDSLLLNDPFGVTVFTFKRVITPKTINIAGVWTMNQFGNTRTSLSVQISPTQIILCQGASVYNYNFPANQRNIIQLKEIKNTCPSQELIKAVKSIKYYRLNNGILDLYDNNITVAIEMVYSQAYDPNKNIFAAPASPATAPPPTGQNQNAQTTSSASVSANNLSGNWSVGSLFNIPFPNSPYYLSITSQSITLKGGCGTYSYTYSLSPTTQVITIGNASSTVQKQCSSSDDGLYLSGIQKMYKYLISNTTNGYSLMFYDKGGNIGYNLTNQKSSTSNSNQVKTQSKPEPFAQGVILMLLLKRRDLPRVIVNVTSNTLTFSICNTMTFKFTVADRNALQGNFALSLTSSTSKSCSTSNDQLFKTALTSATSYTFDPDAKVITLKDKSGQDVITFNRAS